MSHRSNPGPSRRGGALVAALLVAGSLAGCASEPGDPLVRLSRQLDVYPEYAVVLADMDIAGTFFKSYHHRYTVVYGQEAADNGNRSASASGSDGTGAPSDGSANQPDAEGSAGLSFESETLNWVEVSPKFFERYEALLGMVVLSKTRDSQSPETANYPPGYQYIGNPNYGSWRTDSNGSSFWEFYGKYALFSHLLGSFNRPIYRADYDSYRSARTTGRTYFGPSNNYGTRGSYTKTSNPTFYQRQQVRQRSQNQRFSQKVRSRASSSRSRSGARGK
ncbi:MAG: hypothetical protein AAF560_11240 [Acidobacteriota bacterium]